MISERQAHKFCKDDISKIENYDKAVNDPIQMWEIHHRLELTMDGEFALSRDQLKMHDMYYNRPYYELIFLTPTEHRRLHYKDKSKKPFTEEHCRHISESKKGENNPHYGKPGPMKGKHHSEETIRKMSESHKGQAAWNKGKKLTEEHRRKLREASRRRWASVKK